MMTYSAEAYSRMLRGLLPRGAAFDRLGSDSNLVRFFAALGDELARVDARMHVLLAESDPRSAVETLADWERMLALPDDRVLAIPGTTSGRQSAITAKYIAREGQNYAFFERLINACGYALIRIDTYASETFRVGDRVTDSLGVGGRLFDQTWAYAVGFVVDAAPPLVSVPLTQAETERVVAHAVHAHIQPVFTWS